MGIGVQAPEDHPMVLTIKGMKVGVKCPGDMGFGILSYLPGK